MANHETAHRHGAVARIAVAVTRALHALTEGHKGLVALKAKTPDQLEDIGLSFIEMDRLGGRHIA